MNTSNQEANMILVSDKQEPENGAETELLPAWSALIVPISNRYEKSFMNQFGRYCSYFGIEPVSVTDEVLAGFERWALEDGLNPFKKISRSG